MRTFWLTHPHFVDRNICCIQSCAKQTASETKAGQNDRKKNLYRLLLCVMRDVGVEVNLKETVSVLNRRIFVKNTPVRCVLITNTLGNLTKWIGPSILKKNCIAISLYKLLCNEVLLLKVSAVSVEAVSCVFLIKSSWKQLKNKILFLKDIFDCVRYLVVVR